MSFRRVDIELEVWRSGRSGVSARTVALVRRRRSRLAEGTEGGIGLLSATRNVGRNRESRVVMETGMSKWTLTGTVLQRGAVGVPPECVDMERTR
jgi:hypothetical protein